MKDEEVKRSSFPSSFILPPSSLFGHVHFRLLLCGFTLLSFLPLPLLAQDKVSTAFDGLPEIHSLAFCPQGALFATIPDTSEIVQVLAPGLTKTLVRTGGKPAGLAIDARGTLYVADPGRKAILKVTPWGEVSVAADRAGEKHLVEPLDVAVSGSNVFFVDAGSSSVCDLTGRVFTDRISGPVALAVNSLTGVLIVADRAGDLWQVAKDGPSRRLASLRSPLSGLDVDAQGIVYAAGESGLVVLDTTGRILRSEHLGPVSDVVFGKADRTALFLPGRGSSTVYRLQASNSAQPDSPPRPFRITEPMDGQILNRHDGVPTGDGLRIEVKGKIEGQGPVTVNGVRAKRSGGEFQADVVLANHENQIVAKAGARNSDQVTVVWDRDSFPRYRISIDDNIRWVKEIALHDPPYRSIFENSYLAFWREMHLKYGAKVHFNIYYEMSGFNLTQMPDRYRSEWQANADWMRLTFHARSNNPDRPYVHSTAERIREDYRLVNREIERFAGEELLSDVTTIHWGETTSAAVQALREEGVKTLVGYFELRRELPAVSYDVKMPQVLNLMRRDYWKDVERDLLFVRHDMVINGVRLDQIEPRLEKLAADPHQSEIIELMIHEQHWYPDFTGYLPDYKKRVERAIQWVTRRGYTPVFFGDGFVGAQPKP